MKFQCSFSSSVAATTASVATTLWSLLLLTSFNFNPNKTSSSSSSSSFLLVAAQDHKNQDVFREHNMDFWDSDTLAYFLDEYPGYDATVMFYSRSDRASHALSPYYGQIGAIFDAGTSDSRLVMALFDCEYNIAHAQLCELVGITHYPTLLFIGSGPYHDTDPITKTIFGKRLSAGQYGNAPVPNTVKFQGNWQYPDSIIDWIRAMQALSNWHTWTTQGFGKRLRNFLLPHKKPQNTPLPIGIPASASSAASRSSSGSKSTSSSSSYESEYLESMVDILSNRTSDLEKIVLRSSTLLDSVLLPPASDKQQDMFELLSSTGALVDTESSTPTQEVLRNCVLELTLDYCQRLGAKLAQDVIDDMEKNQGMSIEEIINTEGIEDLVLGNLATEEPYCSLLEECFQTDFDDEKCRPKQCPFNNKQACNYLTSCLDPDIQNEYADALGLTLEPESSSPEGTSSTSDGEKKKGWF